MNEFIIVANSRKKVVVGRREIFLGVSIISFYEFNDNTCYVPIPHHKATIFTNIKEAERIMDRAMKNPLQGAEDYRIVKINP